MKKISFKIDLTKIDKNKITERKYQNKQGEEVTVKEFEFEGVFKDEKVIKDGETWELVKTGFVTGKGVKQADGSYSKEPIFGDIIEIRDKGNKIETPSVEGQGYNGELGEVNVDDIPF